MVPRHRHGPAAMFLTQLLQEAGSVSDVLVWHEHFSWTRKLLTVIVMVDLHATQINQLLAFATCIREMPQCIAFVFRKDRLAFDIQGKRMQSSLVSALGETHRI